jgi:hypothetical protein
MRQRRRLWLLQRYGLCNDPRPDGCENLDCDGAHGYTRISRGLGRVDLLILDDWGLEPLDAQARHDLLEILEERYGRRSTIVTSQLPIEDWHAVIADATYADAILDRLVHNAVSIRRAPRVYVPSEVTNCLLRLHAIEVVAITNNMKRIWLTTKGSPITSWEN